MNTTDMSITAENFPAAFAAMDKEAQDFWAYSDADWQDNFLHQWAQENQDTNLLRALEAAERKAAVLLSMNNACGLDYARTAEELRRQCDANTEGSKT